ncbi:MAG TPA: cbb3-type cytochrome c oxidase subunit II [Opitutaceae bacterium]|nr:cbb3-type cytochrome c oxidase subunit II [Opitutaceae bacterium]
MKNGPLLFLGLFAAFGLSWAGLALGTSLQLGSLAPYYDQLENRAFPERAPGIASRGKLVYQDLGCAACHTQEVRRAGFGSDTERKWGDRQSYARDYIHQDRLQLGLSRVGPDLTNVGGRLKTAGDVFKLLYHGTATMPAYSFLFDERPLHAEPSPKAVAVVDGHEIVPSARAEVLAAYLLNLKTPADYPVEKAVNTVVAKKEEAHK